MDFSTSNEQRLLEDTVDRLLRDHGYPELHRKIVAKDRPGGSAEVWQSLSELGLPAMAGAAEAGGMEATATEMASALQVFGRCGSLEPVITTMFVTGLLLRQIPEDPALAAFGPSLFTGKSKLAFALDEQGCRHDLRRVKTEAQRSGNGYVLNGSKLAVLHGDEADFFLVLTRTSGRPGDTDGLSFFVVGQDAPGLRVTHQRLIDGRGAANLRFEGLLVGETSGLGAEGQALELADRIADLAALGLAADALGALERISQLTVDYLQVREQFGRPIGSFQVLQHRLVDMLHDLEHLKSLVYVAAYSCERGTTEARQQATSALNRFLGTRIREAVAQAIQMHGGIGVTEDYELGRHVKRILVASTLFGDADFHVARLGQQLCA